MNAALAIDSGRSIREDGLVCCATGSEQYALRGADVRHIVRVEQMHGGPGSDGRIGTLEVAGQPVPVFRLGTVLGRPSAPAARADQHIAVTGERGELVGWLVDRIVRTPLSQDALVVSLPAVVGATATTWFEALVKLGDNSVLLLAPQYLNPLARRPARPDATRAFSASARKPGREEPMVLLFSTPALPRCEATRFALSGRRIAAIAQPLSPIVVPGGARHVRGVAWGRDGVVPVIDFRGPGEHDDAAQRRRQADGVERPGFVVGVFDVDGERTALLDLDRLLAPEQAEVQGIPA